MTATTDTEPDYTKKITEVLGHEEFEDCEGCDWRIRFYPKFKFFTEDEDVRQYNHSRITDITETDDGYEITIMPWGRHPGEPERVVLDAARHEIRQDDGTWGQWRHVSLNHPWHTRCETCNGLGTTYDRSDPDRPVVVKCTDCDGTRVCSYARRKARCPKCRSLRVKTTQEAYGDSTKCPECDYSHWFSIGD